MGKPKQLPATFAILSSVPPPFGGVTVHVERLAALLASQGFSFRIYEQQGKSIPAQNVVPLGRSFWMVLKFLLTVPEPVVHLHTSSIGGLLVSLTLLLLRRKKVLLTLHSEKPMRQSQRLKIPGLRSLFMFLLKRTYTIAVSDRIASWLMDSGVNSDRVTIAPAFLPPSDSQLDEGKIPTEVNDFVDAHTKVVGTQGWFGYFLSGRHVYSFEMIAELIAVVCRDDATIGFYTVISGVYDRNHREAILAKRREMRLESNWMIIEKDFHAAALYKKSHLFVRPTITDGDAVSVRECLWLGVPVVASDAVDRPAGCVIHANLDLESLTKRVREVLSDLEGHRQRVETLERRDTSSDVLNVFKRLAM